jgi:hypothetical protein
VTAITKIAARVATADLEFAATQSPGLPRYRRTGVPPGYGGRGLRPRHRDRVRLRRGDQRPAGTWGRTPASPPDPRRCEVPLSQPAVPARRTATEVTSTGNQQWPRPGCRRVSGQAARARGICDAVNLRRGSCRMCWWKASAATWIPCRSRCPLLPRPTPCPWCGREYGKRSTIAATAQASGPSRPRVSPKPWLRRVLAPRVGVVRLLGRHGRGVSPRTGPTGWQPC